MKYIFLGTFLFLCAAAAGTYLTLPGTHSDVPVIYWTTDRNPARIEQVDIFNRWMREKGYVTEQGRPVTELRLDTGNREESKVIIQGVSGVAGDVIDTGSLPALQMRHAIGIASDLTEAARALGFSTDNTYESIVPEITIDGRQYMYPANVSAGMLWVNLETLDRFNQPHPPETWDFDTFEAMGKAYVSAANEGMDRNVHFYSSDLSRPTLWRSQGLSMFNETMTACTINDPRYIDMLERYYQWVYIDHIIPSADERASFDTQSGYGGAMPQLFDSGNVVMMHSGRHILIQLRVFSTERVLAGKEPMRLAVVQPPHGVFPVTSGMTRAVMRYKGSAHPELANRFLQYLADEAYNMQIVRDADAMPPNPEYTDTPAFYKPLPLLPEDLPRIMGYSEDDAELVGDFRVKFYREMDKLDREAGIDVTRLPEPPRPAGMADDEYQQRIKDFQEHWTTLIPAYQTEWGLHEKFKDALYNLAIGTSVSPYVLASTSTRIEREEYEKFFYGQQTAERAAANTQSRINNEIARSLREDPSLQSSYDQRLETQKKIDAYREAGKPIPAGWINNPFHMTYYRKQGMLE